MKYNSLHIDNNTLIFHASFVLNRHLSIVNGVAEFPRNPAQKETFS